MTTKREIVDRIQELAWFHLNSRGLCFDNYMYLTKADLERRLANAERMHLIDIQVRELEAKFTSEQRLFAAIFPKAADPAIVSALEHLNNLLRQAREIWLTGV